MARRRLRRGASGLALVVVLALATAPTGWAQSSAGTASAGRGLPPESTFVPPTDCTAHVGYNLNQDLPGYVVPDEQLGRVCVPFTQVPLAPADDRGDYRVDNFTDAAIRAQLAACRTDPSCDYAGIIQAAKDYQPPQFRVTGTIVAFGKIDPHASNLNLADIRRPKFFGQAPYREPIAQTERRAYTVEFTAPQSPTSGSSCTSAPRSSCAAGTSRAAASEAPTGTGGTRSPCSSAAAASRRPPSRTHATRCTPAMPAATTCP
jgi:hypothetical protein